MRSEDFARRARAVIPGGVNSGQRQVPGLEDLVITATSGKTFTDAEGRDRPARHHQVPGLLPRVAALTLSNRVEAGLIRVNAPTSGVDFHAPFGGSKESSIGPREQGLAARDFYTESRTLLIAP
jgi:hypothetical protein